MLVLILKAIIESEKVTPVTKPNPIIRQQLKRTDGYRAVAVYKDG